MQYVKCGYIVKIRHVAYYTQLRISDGLEVVYQEDYLPTCGSRIAAEDNAARIADQWIEYRCTQERKKRR